jgi:predicted Zn-dependent protease
VLFSFTLVLASSSQTTRPKSPAADFATLAAQAEQASQQNRLDDAIVLYRKALALKPTWQDGWWALGTLEYDRDQYAKAAQAFAKLIALNPRHGTAHAMLGLCQFELGSDEPALKNLLSADRLGISKDEQLRQVALYHLGVLQLRTRKFNSAKDTLQELAKDGVRTKELSAALGESALLMRPQEAPAEGTDGFDVVQRSGEAELALATKDFDRAQQIYRDLANEFPTYPNLHLACGRLLLDTHDTDAAIAEFQKELQRDPKNLNALLEIAAVRYQVDSQDGLKYAEQAVTLAPQQPFAHYLLGLLLLDTGNVPRAIAELEQSRQRLPREAGVYFALGNAYAKAGRREEAARARATFTRLKQQSADSSAVSDTYGDHPRLPVPQ